MSNPHDVFKALAPIEWDSINHDDLKTFLTETLGDAQALIDSIPVSLNPRTTQATGRPRSATDPTAPKLPARAPTSSDQAQQLRKEWKEVQVNTKDNPLGVNVYRLGAKDRKGAWFARRSVHEGLTFEKWKLGMEKEFTESLKVQGKPGDGKIRGIGAEKRVVNTVVEGSGKVEVYQLSAQFPGPTTPRDFVTLLLSSDCGIEAPIQEGLAKCRYYMVVSKPCIHPDCPQRSGFIRGQYESVEFIREIKVEKPLRKVRSSIDFSNEESAAARRSAKENLGKDALVRSASRRSALSGSASDVGDQEGRKRGKTISFAGTDGDEEDDEDSETLVEWLMVTRSDPGGSVPRFMVEKGTPAGIAGDADKFLKWISTAKLDDFAEDEEGDNTLKEDVKQAEEVGRSKSIPTANPTLNIINDPSAQPTPVPAQEQENSPGGIYGMIANAIGLASSVVASRLPAFGSAKGGDTESDLSCSDSIHDDSSSINSFHSLDSEHEDDQPLTSESSQETASGKNAEERSVNSLESKKSTAPSQHEKELRKLEDRRRRLQEKMQRAQDRALSRKGQDTQRDESAVTKLREKHDREIAKQEEKYKREMQRLEEKRAQEDKKAEERRKKAIERELKENLAMELDKVRAERDVALKHMDILKEQVRDLQAQNTKLVTALGKVQKGADVTGVLEELRKVESSRSRTADAA